MNLKSQREHQLIELYCNIDDFCRKYKEDLDEISIEEDPKKRKRKRVSKMSLSEIMTISIFYKQLKFSNFKAYYKEHVEQYLRPFFPDLVAYSTFTKLMKKCVLPMYCLLEYLKGKCTGLSIVDSTSLIICRSPRRYSHKLFKGIARSGKSSLGWFFGFKLHVIINHFGEIVNFMLTSGNVNDTKPVPELSKGLFGKLFGDRGYISKKLFKTLFQNGVEMVTKIKKNMKNKLMSLKDKLLLKKRMVIESVFNKLKNVYDINHSRHRSKANFLVNLFSGLVAYALDPKKPSMNISSQQALGLKITN